MTSPARTRYADALPYRTKDGSEIRELMHPAIHPAAGVAGQSLAEATVPPGARTHLHRHWRTEELYHVTAGRGRMRLGEEAFEVGPGDTVCIPPGTAHCIEALGEEPLRLLCCCAPAYGHDDTELLWKLILVRPHMFSSANTLLARSIPTQTMVMDIPFRKLSR